MVYNRAIADKKYRDSHKAKIKAYYQKNKDKIKEYQIKTKEQIRLNETKRRKEKREYFREKWRKNYIAQADKIKDYQKKFRNENKEIIRAELKAYLLIKIPLNQLCEVCKERKATQRHHEDYSKPLEVMFVCGTCHYFLDKQRRLNEVCC